MLNELITNWGSYCTEDNFIGIGSTRKAYRINDYVIKVHTHPLGYKQSLKEMEVWNYAITNDLKELFAKTFFVDELISIQKYYKPIERKNNQSFEIDMKRDQHLIPNMYEEVLFLLDKEFDSFDIKDSDNYGLNNQKKLVFIDYGMTKTLYETEWVPLADSGVLPQIHFDFCNVCGLEKELRMYGDHDQNKRCYSCGKE